MLPLRDHTPPASFPAITYLLIAANAVVFFYMVTLPVGVAERFIETYAVQAAEIVRMQGLITLFTSLFLHGGWAHIIGNMLFLHIFGDNLEDALGKIRYLAFYLLSGIAGSVLQIVFNPASDIPMLGASGAISGVLAGYLTLFPRHRVDVLFTFGFFIQQATVPAFTMIFYWFVFQLFSGLGSLAIVDQATGGVAYFAHIGGFAAGWLLVRLLR